MRAAIYNRLIAKTILKPVKRRRRCASNACSVLFVFVFLMLAGPRTAHAADWNTAEQQLARKIAAVTGPGAVALTTENRSSLGRRDSEAVENGLRSALEQLGARFVKPEQAAATVEIVLSENPASYVWVAKVKQGEGEAGVVMVSVPRSASSAAVRDSMPMSVRKTLIWAQDEAILDVAILEESAAPTRIAVLDGEKISIYQSQNGKWQQEQAAAIPHLKAWPRDLRGRLAAAKDHLLDVFLPGMTCRLSAGAAGLNCREADDPWPLVPEELNAGGGVFPSMGSGKTVAGGVVAPMAAFFAPTRNFFTGVVTPPLGKFTTVAKFYSAAELPRGKYTLWIFSAVDGRVHMIDGVSDQVSQLEWGSDIATVRTSCGAGWQVLAGSTGEENGHQIRAYEFPDRDPVAVSAATDLPGPITALWTESKGDTAIVVVKDEESGSYEAFRLAVACNQ